MPYFCRKIGKMLKNLSSAAVVIGALRVGRRFSRNNMPYFCRKLGKMLQNLSSAAVVIGDLRVNCTTMQL